MVFQNNTEQGESRRTNRGCWLIAGVFVGLPVLLLFIGMLLLIARDQSANREVSMRLAERQANGLPVGNESLGEYHERLTSDRDTSDWVAVIEELTSDAFKASTTGVPLFDPQVEKDVPSSPQLWEQEIATRDFLNRWSSLHSRVQRLSLRQLEQDAMPVRFPIDFDSINTLLPYTQDSRAAARLLQLHGQVAVFDRNSSAVRRSIVALFGCANALSGEPILISQLVSLAIDGMALDLLRTALKENVVDEEDLMILLPHVLARTKVHPAWRPAIHGEIAMMMPVFSDPAQAAEVGNTTRLPARSRDSLYYLDHMDGVLAVSDEDMGVFMEGLDAREAELMQLFSGSLITKFDSILTGMLAPAIASAGKAFVRDAVQNRQAAVCIGLRLYEKRNGVMPPSLNELKSVGLDPAKLHPPGQQPFGYRVDDEQALVWGFDVRDQTQVSPEPPVIDPAAPYADLLKIWTWQLPLQKQ